METSDLRAAALLGAASGMRTFAGLATLGARGRLPLEVAQLRGALTLAAAGEVVADKLPFTPARTAELPYLGRVIAGFLSGAAVAGPAGALTAALTSATATQLAYRKRRFLTTRLRLPDLPVALIEDAIAYAAAGAGAAQRPS